MRKGSWSPATPAFTRPEAVKLKRFFAADLVFILGISISMVAGNAWHATLASIAGYSSGPYRRASPGVQADSGRSLPDDARNHPRHSMRYIRKAIAAWFLR